MNGEVLGPQSFGLGCMFRVDRLDNVSAHLALNFSYKKDVDEEEDYDHFWDRPKIRTWTRGECIPMNWTLLRRKVDHCYSSSYLLGCVNTFPLFGLWELGNLTVKAPLHPELEQAASRSGNMVYLQLYTPFVKTLEDRMPLLYRPNLLTYMLGERYIRMSPKFRKVWEEVNSEKTKHELMEAAHPDVPFQARLEVVIKGRDLSFLASFDHCSIAQMVIESRLLVKVSE